MKARPVPVLAEGLLTLALGLVLLLVWYVLFDLTSCGAR